MIRAVSLPLNLDQNRNHPFHGGTLGDAERSAAEGERIVGSARLLGRFLLVSCSAACGAIASLRCGRVRYAVAGCCLIKNPQGNRPL